MLKLKEKDFNILIEDVKENMKLRRLSDKTIINYVCALKNFYYNCNYKGKLKDFKEEDLIIYMKKELLDKYKSPDTYNLHLAAIKKLFIVCFKKSFISDLIPRAKNKRKMPSIVTKKDFLNIINNEKNLNHKCWLLLSFCCGLRRFEIANLKIENIHAKEHYLKVIGKGNKERKTILPDIVIYFLRKYYKEVGMNKKEGYLFEGNKRNKSKHINPGTITNYFTDLKESYKLDENYTHHSLRHSFGTYFIMNGGNLEDLQMMMGHDSIVTTTIYLHLAQNFNKLKGINYHE